MAVKTVGCTTMRRQLLRLHMCILLQKRSKLLRICAFLVIACLTTSVLTVVFDFALYTRKMNSKTEIESLNAKDSNQRFAESDLKGDDVTSLRMKERVLLLRRRCANYSDKNFADSDTRARLFYSKSVNATLCYVPKAGCTFWKRMFLLAERNGRGRVFDTDHLNAHGLARSKMLNTVKFDRALNILVKSTKLLFTREPFSRLFSVYIDKFYLSKFWLYGGRIISFFRPYPNATMLTCGSDVRFEEFLKFVIRESVDPPYEGPQEHWIPVHRLCQPCVIEYDIIGHQETFEDDRKFIMRELSFERFLPTPISLSDTFRDAIYQILQVDWTLIKLGKGECISGASYRRRIWQALIYQGYLPWAAKFPVDLLGEQMSHNASLDSVLQILLSRTYVENMTPDDWFRRKTTAMANTYKSIDLELKEKIRKHFELDQRLFGYYEKPSYVYS